MPIPAKERFRAKLIRAKLPAGNEFPPKKIRFQKKDLVCLGVSNLQDLIPKEDEDREFLIQYVYCDMKGNLYEVCLKDPGDEIKEQPCEVLFHSIRTRQK